MSLIGVDASFYFAVQRTDLEADLAASFKTGSACKKHHTGIAIGLGNDHLSVRVVAKIDFIVKFT